MSQYRQRTTPAKITRPVISRAYLRKRLFRLLDEWQRCKAIWIGGPPGSGKTTVVSSYIESKSIPCIWYQVDYRDNDPATFFHYLALAVKGLIPGRRKPLPHFTPEYRGALITFARNFFHEMFCRMPNPALLVFDNLQEASEDTSMCSTVTKDNVHNPPIPPLEKGGKGGFELRASPESGLLDILCTGLTEAPDGCSAILISRNAPPQPFARLCVNRDMKVVGHDELLLTDEEFSGIAKVLGYRITGQDKVSHLQKFVKGWTAGLILMKTSLLPEMTGEMAQELTGNAESHRILKQLDSQRFFTDSRSHSEAVYQYHPLFREFLQSCANGLFNREELKEYQKRGAYILNLIPPHLTLKHGPLAGKDLHPRPVRDMEG